MAESEYDGADCHADVRVVVLVTAASEDVLVG
jgi:hypothetical protein